MAHALSQNMRRFEVHIPFQVLRHSWLAQRARRWIYYVAIGKEGYPFVFKGVAEGEELPYKASPHLYIHIPFCRSLCTHCPYNKIVFRTESYLAYAKALQRELRHYLAQQDTPRIQTLYFGGGTPSMTPELIEQVITLTQPLFAENIDLRPTFEQLAGAPTPTSVDGHSLMPLLEGLAGGDWRNAALVEHRSVFTKNDPDRPGANSGNPPSYEAIRTPTFVYVQYTDGEREYYDLQHDPNELQNLAAQLPPARLASLNAEVTHLELCHGSFSCWSAAHLPAG